VGQNTWELWLLKTGGGWFHPIHIHLVSFFVLIRNKVDENEVHSYEKLAAKDVVDLGMRSSTLQSFRFRFLTAPTNAGPGDKVWVVARCVGPAWMQCSMQAHDCMRYQLLLPVDCPHCIAVSARMQRLVRLQLALLQAGAATPMLSGCRNDAVPMLCS
jgi:hypothetical protein